MAFMVETGLVVIAGDTMLGQEVDVIWATREGGTAVLLNEYPMS